MVDETTENKKKKKKERQSSIDQVLISLMSIAPKSYTVSLLEINVFIFMKQSSFSEQLYE